MKQFFERHHLIYLDKSTDFSIVSLHADKKKMEKKVMEWLANELPCVYAKQTPNEEQVYLGVTLLENHKKQRVALRMPPETIKKQRPLPELFEMSDFFLNYYGIKGLNEFSGIAVYGSFLFHYLSGQTYVNSHSDLDLLITYQNNSLASLGEQVKQLTDKFQRTIDGEVRFAPFGDVSLKELLKPSATKLLCKTRENVILLPRTELYEYYPML